MSRFSVGLLTPAAVLATTVACVGLLAPAACAKKHEPLRKVPLGAACQVGFECKSHACADEICVAYPRKSGESCGNHAHCPRPLKCYKSTNHSRLTHRDPKYSPSVTYGDVCRTPEEIATLDSERKKAATRKQLRQSGVDTKHVQDEMTAVETRPAAAGAGLPVRVVRTETLIDTATGHGLAACRRDERLTGGSCSKPQRGSGPSNFGKTDTVGGRWVCVGRRNERVVAHALCQKVPGREAKPPAR